MRGKAFGAAAMATCALLAAAPAGAGETTTYTYDALGRVTGLAISGTINSGQGVSTSLDAADNRMTYTVTNAGGGSGSTPSPPQIIVPSSYSASSNYGGYTGLSGTGAGMRDETYQAGSTIHGTNSETNAWIMMDLGSTQSVGRVVMTPADVGAPGGWGYTYLNGATLEQSTNGTSWTTIGTVTSSADGVPVSATVNASTRYLRLRKSNTYVGVGDFYAVKP